MQKSEVQSKKVGSIDIPIIQRDRPLIKSLLIVVLGGFDGVLDKEGQLYFRLLCRLIDKSVDEYLIARDYIAKELKSGDKLAYRFEIINHLENCINAINRAIKTFKWAIEKNSNLLQFIDSGTIAKIKSLSVSEVRNRIEHIDEDIFKNKFKKNLFLDADEEYKKICINEKCISFVELASIIENYHSLVREIFNK
ncbi:MAG: hypothetical protein QXI58_03770, partial [Candidatus Micrarchaeia archaeon]